MSKEIISIEKNTSLLIERGAKGSDNTQKQFISQMKKFSGWLNGREINIQTVCLFLSSMHLTGSKKATIDVMKSNISKYLRLNNANDVTTSYEVVTLMKGLSYELESRQKQAKSFDSFDDVKILLRAIENRKHRFMFSLMFYGAFRMDELRTLKNKSIIESNNGLIVSLITSKTNQTGEFEYKYFPYMEDKQTCPANLSLSANLKDLDSYTFGTKTGKCMSKSHFSKMFKRYFGKEYSTHSARATFVTCTIGKGATIEQVMKQTGHKSILSVKKYNRKNDCIKDNAINLLK